MWAVLGSPHPLTPPRRPHNSLYVISPNGGVATRYDKRFLSNTELTWMYTPGSSPVVFEAGGLRFGCALCIEVHFPELFAEYERLDADCVLVSVMVDDPVRLARPWRRAARAGLFDKHLAPEDPRSVLRTSF